MVTVGDLHTGGPVDSLNELTDDTSFVMAEHLLPYGDLLNFRLYVREPGQRVRLQIWRPVASQGEGERFQLIYDLPHTFTEAGYQVVSMKISVSYNHCFDYSILFFALQQSVLHISTSVLYHPLTCSLVVVMMQHVL